MKNLRTSLALDSNCKPFWFICNVIISIAQHNIYNRQSHSQWFRFYYNNLFNTYIVTIINTLLAERISVCFTNLLLVKKKEIYFYVTAHNTSLLLVLSIFYWRLQYEKLKCVIFKCYSSVKLITLNIFHEVVLTWYSFHRWVDWSNANKIYCSRKQHTAAGVPTVYLCIQNRHSSQPTNMF